MSRSRCISQGCVTLLRSCTPTLEFHMLFLSSSTFELHGPWRGGNVAPPAYLHDVQYLIFWGHLRLAPEEASMLFTLLRLYWAVGVVTSVGVTTRKCRLPLVEFQKFPSLQIRLHGLGRLNSQTRCYIFLQMPRRDNYPGCSLEGFSCQAKHKQSQASTTTDPKS